VAIFLSKTGTSPYQEITIDNLAKENNITIDEKSGLNSSDVIETIYLILTGETKTELRLKVENELKTGGSLWISKCDINENPIKWEKLLIFNENLDTLQYDKDEISIPIKFKWSIINNIYFNTQSTYGAFINIYDII